MLDDDTRLFVWTCRPPKVKQFGLGRWLIAETLSAAFKGRDSAPRRKAVEKALETLAAAGAAQRAGDGQDGESRYFIPR